MVEIKRNSVERKKVSPNSSVIYLRWFKLVRTGNASFWQVLELQEPSGLFTQETKNEHLILKMYMLYARLKGSKLT